MEDAATAEISRSQIWQWLHHGRVSREEVLAVEREVLRELGVGYQPAAALFRDVALDERFVEFMTLPGYRLLP
jgi:malate synthase